MAFTTRQAVSEEKSAQQAAVKPSVQLFNDQRASTSVQLKQQQLMQTAQSPAQFAAEEEEPLQGKFVTAQLAEEEELLQGKFDTAQLAEEEELLQGKFSTTQLMEEEEPLQGKFETAQLAEEEELLQGKFSNTATAQLEEKPNNTGLPNQLKSGIESLSGMSLDGVKVHYNSDKPAQLNAHAYAQGTDIHVAPGQEQHLPHEAWHVVQQAQGRVKPTTQMKGTSVNDDVGLETEADVMGAKATQLQQNKNSIPSTGYFFSGFAAQRKVMVSLKDSGDAKRTTGSGPELTAQVDTTIAGKNMVDMRDTASALTKSIAHRRTAPVVGVEATPGGHDARIALEESLLARLNTAITSLEAEQKAASIAKSNASLAGMPDLGLKNGPTGKAWGK